MTVKLLLSEFVDLPSQLEPLRYFDFSPVPRPPRFFRNLLLSRSGIVTGTQNIIIKIVQKNFNIIMNRKYVALTIGTWSLIRVGFSTTFMSSTILPRSSTTISYFKNKKLYSHHIFVHDGERLFQKNEKYLYGNFHEQKNYRKWTSKFENLPLEYEPSSDSEFWRRSRRSRVSRNLPRSISIKKNGIFSIWIFQLK